MQLYNALYLDGSGNVTLRTSGSGGGGGSTGASIADALIIDAAGLYWYTVITEPSAGGTPTITYLSLSAGTLGTPTAPVKPAATSKTVQTVETQYDAIAAGTGYSIGDSLLSVILLDSSTATVMAACWVNATTQLIITTPSSSNIVKSDQNVKVSGSVSLSTGANSIGSVGITSLPQANTDVFSQIVIAERQNDVSCAFMGTGTLSTLTTQTYTGSSAGTWVNGQALFSTGTTNTSTLLVSSIDTVVYVPGNEVYAYFTSTWATNAAGTFQRHGITDTVNGFFIGYEGTVMSASMVTGGTITTVPQSSWNTDTLTGTVNSKFTRNGTPEAINFSYQNVFRIRFGWLGSASIQYEVLSPDATWVIFHVIRTPNIQTIPSIQNSNLPMSVWMSSNGVNLTIGTSCWAAGTSSPYQTLAAPLNTRSLVSSTRSVINGITATGTYTGVLVDNTGALTLAAGSNLIGGTSTFDGSGNAISSLLAGPGQLSLLVAQGETNFVISTNNSSAVQLASNATYTGAIESILNQQSASILLTADQPVTFTINQYIDAAGLRPVTPLVYNLAAGATFDRCVTINGNYFNISVKNTGLATTTTFNVNTAYGTLPAVTQLGNNPSAINEINGVALNIGNQAPALSIPVISADSALLYTGTVSTTGAGSSLDTTGFGSVTIQTSGTGSFSGWIEGSNDGVTWDMLWVLPLDATTLRDTIIAPGNYSLRTTTRYIRYNTQVIIGSVVLVIVGRSSQGPSAADFLSLALDTSNNTPLNVSIQSGLKTDSTTGLILSDAPTPILLEGNTTSTLVIDTTGYQSISITSISLAGSMAASNDGVTWSTLSGISVALGAYVTAIAAGASYNFPCLARYIRITVTGAGSATAYLRSQPWSGIYTTTVPTSTASNNLAQVGSTAVVTGGLAGTLAVGGSAAVAAAQTSNPVVAGAIDQASLTRRLVSDSTGRLRIAAVPGNTSAGVPNTADLPAILNTIQNTAAISVQDTSQFEGKTLIELVSQLLVEMKIANQYLYDLPRILQSGQSQSTDEPDSFRNDPTIFNQ